MAYRPYNKPYWNNFASEAPAGEPGVSKYNSGMLTNQRLHNLWVKCQNRWELGFMDKLNDILDLVWVELYADSTPEQQEAIRNFDKSICELTERIKLTKDLKERVLINARLAIMVKNKFLFLKTVEKKQGRGLAYKDEFEDDFD
jgi:hypothetical protein